MSIIKFNYGQFFVGNLWDYLRHRSTRSVSRLLRKPLFPLVLALTGIFLSILVIKNIAQALSRDFVQTDWSGGADTGLKINDSNLTGWTKYYSKTGGMVTSVAGEVKLKLETSGL